MQEARIGDVGARGRVARAEGENLRPADLVAELLAGSDIVVVDVREPDEVSGGVIAGALLVPRGVLEFAADPSDAHHHRGLLPERRVILYCSNGTRSALAVHSLYGLGYRDVAHLAGGVEAWRSAGHELIPPVQSDRGRWP
jgi:rhodanese-related sulfurtransferase